MNAIDRNTEDVGRRRIVFVGASYLFVHKVLRDMLIVGGFDNVHLVVHDIDAVPLTIVADLLEKIARQRGSRVTVSRTLDREEALRGADAVLLAITVGGQESDQRTFEVCANYGIPVCVGDTLGPTALARNLRTVPVVVGLVRDMERLCPNAVLLNFTNPMSVLTGAMARTSHIPVFGLCHSADELFSFFGRVFGVPPSEIALDVGGVNHQSFVCGLRVKGVDRMRDMPAEVRRSGAKVEDKLLATTEEDTRLQQDVCAILGVWPSCGADHLAEFYRYFLTERRIEQLHLTKRRRRVLPGRAPFGRKECPDIIRRWTYEEPAGDLDLLTSEHAHEILYAYFTGTPYTRVLNVLNRGPFLAGIPADACVEALVTLDGRTIRGPAVTLPPAAHALVANWTAIHELSIRAALGCDRDAARQALFLDPHVRDCYDIAPLLDDLLAATRPWLPEEWFGGAR
jgi:alpha-galactosidase